MNRLNINLLLNLITLLFIYSKKLDRKSYNESDYKKSNKIILRNLLYSTSISLWNINYSFSTSSTLAYGRIQLLADGNTFIYMHFGSSGYYLNAADSSLSSFPLLKSYPSTFNGNSHLSTISINNLYIGNNNLMVFHACDGSLFQPDYNQLSIYNYNKALNKFTNMGNYPNYFSSAGGAVLVVDSIVFSANYYGVMIWVISE